MEIEKRLGERLPVATLFQAQTIAQIADMLRLKKSSATWSSLVEIQRNGSKPPLFCVHTLEGEVIPYFELAKNLGFEQVASGPFVRSSYHAQEVFQGASAPEAVK